MTINNGAGLREPGRAVPSAGTSPSCWRLPGVRGRAAHGNLAELLARGGRLPQGHWALRFAAASSTLAQHGGGGRNSSHCSP